SGLADLLAQGDLRVDLAVLCLPCGSEALELRAIVEPGLGEPVVEQLDVDFARLRGRPPSRELAHSRGTQRLLGIVGQQGAAGVQRPIAGRALPLAVGSCLRAGVNLKLAMAILIGLPEKDLQ